MANYLPEYDIEFLQPFFEELNEEIIPSHRISPEILLQKLQDEQPGLKVRRVWFTPKRAAAVLCAGLIVCAAIVYANLFSGQLSTSDSAAPAAQPDAGMMQGIAQDDQRQEFAVMEEAQDYSAVRMALSAMDADARYDADAGHVPSGGYGREESEGGMGGGNGAAAEGKTDANTAALFGASKQEKSGSADILQTDGSYLYYATGDAVMIANTTPDGQLTLASQIEVAVDDRYVIALYQQDNALTLLCNDYSFTVAQATDAQKTEQMQSVGTTVLMYDITNRQTPILVREFTQEGEYRGSLVSGQMIQILSERKTFLYTDTLPIEALVPSVRDSAWGGEAAARPIGSAGVILPEDAGDTSYVTVSTLHLFDSDAAVNTRTILGGAEQIYCSPTGVYFVNTASQNDTAAAVILKLSFDSQGGALVARGWLDGTIIGLSAAADGGVRVITQQSAEQTEYLLGAVVLNEELTLLKTATASITGQAGSAYFVGNNAYIAAKEKNLLLAVFGFTDEDVLQQKTITEPSALPDNLITLTESFALGVYAGSITGDGAGLSASLFYTQDGALKEASSVTLGASGSYTEALRISNAVLYDEETGLLGIPVTLTGKVSDNQLKREFSGYSLYRVANEGLTRLGKIASATLKPQDELRRGILANGLLYTASDNTLVSVNPGTLSVIDSLSWRG